MMQWFFAVSGMLRSIIRLPRAHSIRPVGRPFRGLALPLIFLCEDNGIGISTKTPPGWVEMSMSGRAGLDYVSCNGLDVVETYRTVSDVAGKVRQTRKPVFVHMKTVRLYGHAGADAQQAYLSKHEIETDEASDPLLHTARILIENKLTSADEVLARYESVGAQVEAVSREVVTRPRLENAKQVMASIIPPRRRNKATNGPSASERERLFGESDNRALATPQHMAKLINFALSDLMLEHGEIILAGEDVGPKGGVYGVTQRLHERFGARRVVNTLLDEQSILGLAIGMAQNGFLPIPEIQFLAYLHNAEDQLRGEAATLSFFSNGQFTNPMVLRIAGLGYQRGFGGHFHNDNSLAVLRDIPGIIVAVPSNGRDAVLMLRECIRLAREEQRVVVFVEPIALYMTRDLHEPKDGGWMFDYPHPGQTPIGFGEIGTLREGRDLAIITYGNGAYLSCQAEKILKEKHGLSSRVIDLHWIAPLPKEKLLAAVKDFSNILIVDECRASGSPSEALMAILHEGTADARNISRYTAEDSFIATGPAYGATLPSRDGIVTAALDLMGKGGSQ